MSFTFSTGDQEHQVFFGVTRLGKGQGLMAQAIAADPAVGYVDAKASIWRVSRTQAKKRLMAAGLTPAAAAAAVKAAASRPAYMQGDALRQAMKHHRRHSRRWFPWDTVLGPGPAA